MWLEHGCENAQGFFTANLPRHRFKRKPNLKGAPFSVKVLFLS